MITTFSGQFGLMAQGTNGEDWANVLVLVVMASLWLLAGLTKTMSKKRSQGGPLGSRRGSGEGWQERLARKAREWQQRLEEETGVREPPKRHPAPRQAGSRSSHTPGGKVVVRPGSRGESVVVYERPEPQPPARREPQPWVARRGPAQVKDAVAQTRPMQTLPGEKRIEIGPPELGPPIEDRRNLIAEMSESLEPGRARSMASGPGDPGSSALLDCNDPDALRRAILHYEILAKPLALRDNPGQSVAF